MNRGIQKPLSVITIGKEFLSSIEKFTLSWLDAIFGFTNFFFNLRNKNVILSDNVIWLKERSHQYKEPANQAKEKVKQLKIDFVKEVEN